MNVIAELAEPEPWLKVSPVVLASVSVPSVTPTLAWTMLPPTLGSLIEIGLALAVEKSRRAAALISWVCGTLSVGGETLSANVAVVVGDSSAGGA